MNGFTNDTPAEAHAAAAKAKAPKAEAPEAGAKATKSKSKSKSKAKAPKAEAPEAGTKAPEADGLADGLADRLEAGRVALAQALEAAEPGKPIRLDPQHVLIYGLDTPDDPADPLHDPDRVALPLDEQQLEVLDEVGVLPGGTVPLVLRDGVPFVLDGRQRVKALREVNRRRAKSKDQRGPLKVEAVLAEGMENGDQAAAVSILNYYRQEDPPVTRAKRAAWLMQRFGDRKVVASIMHCTEQNVRYYLAMAEAPEALQDLVKAHDKDPEKGLNFTAAVILLQKIKDAEGVIEVARGMVEAGETTVADAKACALAYNEALEGDEDEGGSGSKGGGAREPGWTPGKPPKKRFVQKVMARYLGSVQDQEESEETALVAKLVGWLTEGQSPPKLLSGHVRAVANEERNK